MNESTDNNISNTEIRNKAKPKVEYSQSGGLLKKLLQLDCSVAISSYQSNSLYHLGCNPKGGLHLHQAAMAKPMGISYDLKGGLTLASRSEIVEFKNVLAPDEKINDIFLCRAVCT